MANDLSALIPQVWSAKTIQRINQTNLMLGFTNRDYEGEIKAAGDTVYVRTFGDVVVTNYTRGQQISYSDLAPTKESMTVKDSKSFAFAIDRLDIAQNDLSALDGYADRAAVALNNTIETKLQSVYGSSSIPSGNKINNAGSAYTISASNAYSIIVDAGKALDVQHAPSDGRWLVITPTYRAFLLKDTSNVIRSTDLGDEIITSGKWKGGTGEYAPMTARNAAAMINYVGKVAGFDVFWGNTPLSDANGRYCLFGQGQPIAYASQLRDVSYLQTMETTFGSAMRGLLLHDTAVFAEWGKRLGYIQIATTQ